MLTVVECIVAGGFTSSRFTPSLNPIQHMHNNQVVAAGQLLMWYWLVACNVLLQIIGPGGKSYSNPSFRLKTFGDFTLFY